jgi:hypothetical protein
MKPSQAETPTRQSGIEPGRAWRWARRSTQCLALFALVVGPVIGGWQRLDYTRERSSWSDVGWGLPVAIQQFLPVSISTDTLYEVNQVTGGGIAAELFAIPFMDPLAGALALLGGDASVRTLFALAIPIALALVGGRVFCGWFCAFGTLSRWIDALCARVPRYRPFALPRRRWLRWCVLGVAVSASLMGVHLLLYLLLPYLLLQQSIYAAWLLGGGSAIAAVLGGLLVAGVIFGPTAYCAAICPTGATLSLFGRRRVYRLAQPDPGRCGKHCDLCSRACWLQLDPGSGDPGPDCDLCARCVPSCPRTNLRITRAARPPAAVVVAWAGWMILTSTLPAEARENVRPALVLDAEISRGDVTVSTSAVDFTGFRLDADWSVASTGVELSIFVARGELGRPDDDGIIPDRETYRGPLRVEIFRAMNTTAERIELEEPNSPISAQRRRIYRSRLPDQLFPGDRVRVAAIAGWLDEAVEFEVPSRGSRIKAVPFARYLTVSVLCFSGLLTLACVGGSRSEARGYVHGPAGPSKRRRRDLPVERVP